MIKVTENLRKIQQLLAASATAAGRCESDICLLGVSKLQPLQAILELASAGQRHFGENFVQEGLEKISKAGRDDLVWHFIGALQSNKTRQVAEHFDWVHTVDRIKIARRLNEQRPDHAAPLDVCLQVNIDDESSKSGVIPDALADLAGEVAQMKKLRLRGLMCIPRQQEDYEDQRRPFAELRKLRDKLNASGLALDTLSMGMTGDYAAAIAEGATIVRIGTALFGPRG